MVSAIVSHKRNKNGPGKNINNGAERALNVKEDSARLLTTDQKESSFRHNKTSKKRGGGMFGGLFKRKPEKSKPEDEYIPPTMPSTPNEGPLNVTVLTSPEFDSLNPYGVSRANTNISDLTPHVGTPQHRHVGFDPSTTTKEVLDPAVGLSTPNRETNSGRGGGNGSPKGGGNTTPSTYARSNSDASDDGDHARTVEDTMTSGGTEQFTVGTTVVDQMMNEDVLTRTLGLFDDLCQVPRMGENGHPFANSMMGNTNKDGTGLAKGSSQPQNGKGTSGRPQWGLSPSDDEEDDDSFLHSMETTVDDSTLSADRTGSLQTNSVSANVQNPGNNPSTLNKLATTTEEGAELEDNQQDSESQQHENFEVVLESSSFEESPKRRTWFSSSKNTPSPKTESSGAAAVMVEPGTPRSRNQRPATPPLAPNKREESAEEGSQTDHKEMSLCGTGLCPTDDEQEMGDRHPSTSLSTKPSAPGMSGNNAMVNPKATDPKTPNKAEAQSGMVQLVATNMDVEMTNTKEKSESQAKGKTDVEMANTTEKRESQAKGKALGKAVKPTADTRTSTAEAKEKPAAKTKNGHKKTSSLGNVFAKLTRPILGKTSKDDAEVKYSGGNRNSPSKRVAPKKKEKPLWKAVKDPNTGRTYYYHRKTRQTTWNKPADVVRAEKEAAREAVQASRSLQAKNNFPNHPRPTPSLTTATTATPLLANGGAASGKVLATPPRTEEGKSVPASAPASRHVAVSPLKPSPVVETALTSDNKTIVKPSEGHGGEGKPDDNDGREVSHGHEVPQDSLLNKTSFDSSWETKKEISRLLTCLQPPDKASVNDLMKEYEGNEGQLLKRLRDLVESQPFDEPFLDEMPQVDDAPKSSINPSPSRYGVALNSRSRTATTAASRNSATTRSSNKTDRTEKIKNTYRGRQGIDPINENNVNSPTNSSISERGEDTSFSTGLSPGGLGLPPRVPEKIPIVARKRELKVEELTGSRIVPETFDISGRIVRGRVSTDVGGVEGEASDPHFEPEDQYYGDNDTYGTDSVSALSEHDVDFTSRKENFEHARRRALDDAIEREDWELAAALSEGMRPTGDYAVEHGTWTQTEMDKFISQNDWGAVSGVIAQMREGAKSTTPFSPQEQQEQAPTPNEVASQSILRAPTRGSRRHQQKDKALLKDTSLQKRIGSRSQLQHGEIFSESSWTSESSYDSEYDSEYSSVRT